MSTILNTVTLNDFVSNEEINWIEQQKSLMQVARTSGLFKVGTWEPGTGEIRKYDEIDAEEYASIKLEGDDAEQAKVQQGYSKEGSPRRFGLDIAVTWEMRTRNKYRAAITKLTNLRLQMVNRLDLDLSHRIAFGTATSYVDKDGQTVDITVGDGLSLFNTAHTVRGSAVTYRNRLAGNPQFSKGSMELMEQLIVEQTPNQFGEKMTLPFDIVYTTDDPNTVNSVKQELQSTADISAPNAGVVNVYKAKYKHVSLPRLATDANGNVDSAKAKYWGLASSMGTSAYLDIEQEPTLDVPASGSNAEEFSNEDWSFKGRTSYAITVVGAKWIKFSSGDAVA